MTQILVNNSTEFDRIEIVIFGCPLHVVEGNLLKKYNDYQHRTARIRVPANTSGYIELLPLPKIGASPKIEIEKFITGIHDYPFKFSRILIENADMKVSLYKAKTINSFKHLIVYAGDGEPWVKYEILDSADLTYSEGIIEAGIKSSEAGIVVGKYLQADITTSVHVRDMGGVATVGTIIDAEEASTSEINLFTALAMREAELVVAGDYREAWGPNNVPPHGFHPDRNNGIKLLAHRGGILNKRPGDTGDQKGFGLWKHLDVISGGRGDLLVHDRYAIMQEVCRNIWLFEDNGDVPLPKDHPKFVSWSETFHWHPQISPDSFGRRERYKHNGWYEGWMGQDQEHYSNTMLKEAIMLSGSYLLMLVAEMKIFHFITQVSYPTTGRALGRNIMGAYDLYLATNDKRVLAKLEEVGYDLIQTYEAVNGAGAASELASSPVALRLYMDDPHTKIPGLEWIVWEDAIAVPIIFFLANLIGEPKLKLIAFNLGKSIMEHGFVDNRVLKAIRWNGEGKPVGPELASSRQTNYTEWALPCIAMLSVLSFEFKDFDTLKKANELGNLIKNTSKYDNLSSYLIV